MANPQTAVPIITGIVSRFVGWSARPLALLSTMLLAQTLAAQTLPPPVSDAESPDLASPIRADDGLIEVIVTDPQPLPEPIRGDKPVGGGRSNRNDRLRQSDQTSEGPLALADVIASLYRSYPEIERAREAYREANGELIGAWGSFDTLLEGETLSEPTGFYENYRHGIAAARRTWWGGYVAAGYRIGRGDFQPWYKERETDKGGEFKVGIAQALLQGRAIDPQRVAVFQSTLERQRATPILQQALLDASLEAAVAYWEWVAAGALLQAQRELLELATTRGEKFEQGVAAGRFPEIDLILNRQLIAERQALLLAAEQKYRNAAFKLSLFLRADGGQPLVPDDDWLPTRFPQIIMPDLLPPQTLIARALSMRPEPSNLQLQLRQLQLERNLANNQRLPTVNLIAEGSQDVGPPASLADDKDEFLLLIGLEGEVPIQRRKAIGKSIATSAKIAQLNQKLRLQQDKIAIEVQVGINSLILAERIVEQAEISLRAAFDVVRRYQFAFERGRENVDLISLNLLETKANETEIKLVQAQQDWFLALAQLQAALGLDPLEQAISIAELPASDRPGPGNLPPPEPDDEADNGDGQADPEAP